MRNKWAELTPAERLLENQRNAAPQMYAALLRLVNGPRGEADWLEAEAALHIASDGEWAA